MKIQIITIPWAIYIPDLTNLEKYSTIASGDTMQETLQNLIKAINDDEVDIAKFTLNLVIDGALQNF